MKKIISLLLCMILIVVSVFGCSKKTNMSDDTYKTEYSICGQIVGMGRVLNITKVSDNTFYMFVYADEKLNVLYMYKTIDDGDSWEKIKDLDSNVLKEDNVAFTSADVTNDGRVLVSYDVLDEKYSKSYSITKFWDEDEVIYKDESNDLLTSEIIGTGIVINNGKKILVFSNDGSELYQIDEDECLDVEYLNESLFLLSIDSITEYKNGIYVDSYTKLNEVIDSDIMAIYDRNMNNQTRANICSVSDGQISIATSTGVYRYYYKNNIVESEFTDEKGECRNVDGFVMNNQIGYFASYVEDENITRLFKFGDGKKERNVFEISDSEIKEVIVDDVEQALEGELEIYSLYPMDNINRMIQDISKKNQNLSIKYSIGIESESVTRSDAIKTLNSRMMAGDGPDVIIMDGLDVSTIIDSKQLTPIDDIYKEYEQDALGNVCKSFEVDGHIYALPTRFSVYMIYGPKKQVETISDITDLTSYLETSHAETNDLFLYSAENVMEIFYPMYANRIYDGQKINEDELTKYYDDMKNIFSICQMHNNSIDEEFSEARANQMDSFDGFNVIPNVNNLLGTSIEMWPTITMGPLDSQVGIIHMITATDYMNKYYSETFAYKTLNLNGINDVFTPKVIAGVYSKSKNVDLAKKFVGYLLSEEYGSYENSDYVMQSYGGYEKYGLPVCAKARRKISDQYNGMQYTLNSKNDLFEKFDLRTEITDEEQKELEDIYSSLSCMVYQDQEIVSIIEENLEKLLVDEIDLSTAVDKTISYIDIYLKEK